MLFYTVGQVYAVPAMIVCGFAMGVWYDVLRAARRLTRAGIALTALFDALFGAGAAAILAFWLFRVTRLEVRLYALVCAALGMAVYAQVIPPIFGKIRQKFRNIFHKFRNYNFLTKILHFIEK